MYSPPPNLENITLPKLVKPSVYLIQIPLSALPPHLPTKVTILLNLMFIKYLCILLYTYYIYPLQRGELCPEPHSACPET